MNSDIRKYNSDVESILYKIKRSILKNKIDPNLQFEEDILKFIEDYNTKKR